MRNRLTHSLVRRAMELITVKELFFYSEERFIRSKLQVRARVVNGIVDRLDPCSSLVHRALEMSSVSNSSVKFLFVEKNLKVLCMHLCR